MKKIVLFFSVTICLSFGAHAQDFFKKAAAANTSGADLKKLTGNIMDKLVPALGLSDAQKPGTTNAISAFVNDKSRFISIKDMDPNGYTANQDDLFNSLKSKLEKIFLEQQMQKFLGLKPKENDDANVLSNLFY